MVELGKVEAVLGPSDQMPGDDYSQGARLKLYIVDVKEHTKGPQVVISRTHPMLLLRLFELEVPEIASGIVEIKAVAREAGIRSKIAVTSHSDSVDPVGACVGPRGVRVQAVVSELKGEKVDIVAYSDDPREFIANALSPARVSRVLIQDGEKSARVVVPDNQLSLAIGKEGQNARLAARLTGWRIDIKSEQQMAEIIAEEAFALPRSVDPAKTVTGAEQEDYEEQVTDTWDEPESEVEPVPETEALPETQPAAEEQAGEEHFEEAEKVAPSPAEESGEKAEEETPQERKVPTSSADEIDYSGLDRIEAFKLRLSRAQKAREKQKGGKAAEKAASGDKAGSEKKQESVVLHDLSALKRFFGGEKEEEQ